MPDLKTLGGAGMVAVAMLALGACGSNSLTATQPSTVAPVTTLDESAHTDGSVGEADDSQAADTVAPEPAQTSTTVVVEEPASTTAPDVLPVESTVPESAPDIVTDPDPTESDPAFERLRGAVFSLDDLVEVTGLPGWEDYSTGEERGTPTDPQLPACDQFEVAELGGVSINAQYEAGDAEGSVDTIISGDDAAAWFDVFDQITECDVGFDLDRLDDPAVEGATRTLAFGGSIDGSILLVIAEAKDAFIGVAIEYSGEQVVTVDQAAELTQLIVDRL